MAFISSTDLKTKLDLGVSDTKYDTLLSGLATAVLSIWDKLTGMTWARTAHTEYHNIAKYQSTVFLKNKNVDSAETFSLYNDPDWEYTSDDLVDTDEYTVDYDEGIVYRDTNFWEGKRALKVIYTAGYTDAACPAWLKEILIRQACEWFKQDKEGRWAIASLSQPGGSSLNYKDLEDNFLPEFLLMVDDNKRTVS